MSGRRHLNLLFVVSTWFLSTCAVQAQIVPGSIEVKLETVVEWNPELDQESPEFELTPTNMEPLNDGTGRILVSTLAGTIRVLAPQGNSFVLLPEPLLNSNQVGFQLQTESGMTALAVHPDFANPEAFGYGKIYTTTSEDAAVNGGLTDVDVDFFFMFEVHQEVIREWDVSAIVGKSAVNSLPAISVADSRELLRIDQPGPFHNLYDMSFNRAATSGMGDYGELYLSLGDGGNSGSNASTHESQIREPQDLSTIYGNILRINPDPDAHLLVRIVANSTAPNAGQPTYSISPDNPFNGDDAIEDRDADSLAEIYAYGFRSPYRINFDSLSGDLYVGDVGQVTREEITRIQIGGNGGWGRFEGINLFDASVELGGPSPHTPPIVDYHRSEGRTVVGGTVYRGTAIPQLQGKLVFAEYGQQLPHARLFYGVVDSDDPDFGLIREFQIDPEGETFPIDTNGDTTPDDIGLLPDRIFSVEEGADRELYLVSGQDPRSFAPSVPGAYILKISNPVLLGDVNLDGVIDFLDIDPFVQHLTNGTFQAEADVNQDGEVNFLDIQPFVDLLDG